jgi:hypothetical protein
MRLALAHRCIPAVILLSVALPPLFSADTQAGRIATVTISPLSSFGEPITGCRVEDFQPSNKGDRSNYESRFRGLTGTGIPFGQYRVIVKCHRWGAVNPFLVSAVWVERPNEFIVIAKWLKPYPGDYNTGADPRLTVEVVGATRTEHPWIRLVGEYSDETEVDQVGAESQSARFYNLNPGRFFLLLFADDKLVCNNQVDLLGPGAKVKLSVLPSGCIVEGLTAARPVK